MIRFDIEKTPGACYCKIIVHIGYEIPEIDLNLGWLSRQECITLAMLLEDAAKNLLHQLPD